VEMGRSWGKQGPVHMGRGYIYMVRKNREKRIGRPQAWLEDTFEMIAGRHLSWAAKNCSEWSRYNICKTSVPQSPHSQRESGHTSVFIDASANLPEWNSKYQCDIAKKKKRTALFCAASSGNFLLTFRNNLWVPSSGVKNPNHFWMLEVHRIYRSALYAQNVVGFHCTWLNVISFTPLRKVRSQFSRNPKMFNSITCMSLIPSCTAIGQ
jgi:hypothetical protein